MQDFITVTAMVIKSEPVGEYDRRIVLLTRETGKISAFAKYARKPGNKLMAATNLFSFGQFKLHRGRNSYTISDVDISVYFENLRQDFAGAYYGMYFMEICDYYARENNDETHMLKLLYQSMRALVSDSFDNRLVRCIFELKSIMINGEFSGKTEGLSETSSYTVDFIFSTPVEKLFTFKVSEQVLCELMTYSSHICNKIFDRDFKSLEILENIE